MPGGRERNNIIISREEEERKEIELLGCRCINERPKKVRLLSIIK